MIAVADVMKEDSPQAVKELQNMGIRVVMLTGDNERTAKAIGAQAGVDEVIAGVLPDGKESVIRSLKEQGRVAMVGDGINDAPALTRADIGIAIGAGTDVAIDAADVVLMKSRLSDVPAAIRLSRATLKNIHENLFWAFFYNVIGIPLAAGVWIPIFGWTLNPMFGAAAMSLSSFCVVTNALRLNLFKVHDSSKDKKIKQNELRASHIVDSTGNHTTGNAASDMADNNINNNEIHDHKDQENKKENKENKGMTTITVNVTGMMCGHCEAHVNKAVKEAFGVEDVISSHEKGTTVIHAPEKLNEDKIREVIKEAGYEVTGITQE
jgi:P-type Cu2+ transporter